MVLGLLDATTAVCNWLRCRFQVGQQDFSPKHLLFLIREIRRVNLNEGTIQVIPAEKKYRVACSIFGTQDLLITLNKLYSAMPPLCHSHSPW